MSRKFVWLILLFYVNFGECGITKEQANRSKQLIRSVCLPRAKITDDMADGIRIGKHPDEKSLKCYMHCVLELSGVMKKNKVNYEGGIKQMEKLLGGDMLVEAKNLVTKCKNSAVGIKDNCDAAFAFVKCSYENRDKSRGPLEFA